MVGKRLLRPFVPSQFHPVPFMLIFFLARTGIENDEPVGKNDGSAQGKQYFSCKPKYGSFIRPERVDIGDYPVLNDLQDMEEI